MAGHSPTHKQGNLGQSNLRKISGTQPGVLDPTQLSRLLRLPGAKLSFAAFDPLTAHAQGTPDIVKPNITNELYRPKRVVIETAPTGECTWRFVPSAKREEGVTDEGTWPRIVELCGELVELSQDQWDIYKLDPLYECLVRAPPYLTVVRSMTHYHPPSPSLPGKRRPESRSPSPSRTIPPPHATHNKNAFIDSESEDEEEVKSMITENEQLHHKPPTRPFRKRKDEERQKRREKLRRKMQWFVQNDENIWGHHFNEYGFAQPLQTSGRESVTPEPGKRKATSALDTSWSPDAGELEEIRLRAMNKTYTVTSGAKRTRIVPPSTRQLERKRFERSRLKQQRRVDELEARRRGREKQIMDEMMEEVSPPQPDGSPGDDACQDVPRTSNDPSSDSSVNQTPSEDEEACRIAAIEESRRKLAELERDRPLWEQEARKRRLREEAEERAFRAKAEERRRKEAQKEAEARAKAREEREQEEMRKQEQEKKWEQEESIRRERELREQEKRQRQQRWSFGPWTMQRALERYRVLSEAFDSTKFTAEIPLTVDDVPWPVLESPVMFSVEDVSWDRVERFFETIRPHMRFQDYKALVEKSHRRFHPDRWRSRNLLKTVQDEAARGCMEVAANTVAQALTPLWRSLTCR